MESAFYLSSTSTTLTLFTITKALNRHFARTKPPPRPPALYSSRRRLVSCRNFYRPTPLARSSASYNYLCEAVVPLIQHRLQCVSSSAASFGTGSGGGIGDGGGYGGGDGGGGGASKEKLGADVAAFSPDVIILDVGGMTCGGCAASVKRILESKPQVSSASVNLTTETAIVWPVSEAKVAPNWHKELGEELAKHLTNCGFNSNVRDSGRDNFFKVFESKMDEKRIRLKESGKNGLRFL